MRMFKQRADQVLSPVLSRFHELDIHHAQGCYVYDAQGNAYLDFGSGIAVTSTGHCHPEVVAAIKKQVETLIHPCIAVGNSEAVVTCAEKIVSLFKPLEYSCFFEQSGSGAVEAALKLAKTVTKRHKVLAFSGGFHGRSMGALSVTSSKQAYRENLGPMLEGVSFFPFPNQYRSFDDAIPVPTQEHYINALKQRNVITSDLAAVIIEPVLGEGGYVPAPLGFLKEVEALCKKNNVLLIIDEIQSGMGRTGTWFQYQKAGIEPDIVVLAKGLGSGMPIGVCVGKKQLMDQWTKGSHGGTYGSHPVTCAATSATIDVIEKQLPLIPDLSDYCQQLLQPLYDHPYVGDIRIEGLMIGIELVKDKQTKEPYSDLVASILKKALSKQLILLSCGVLSNVIRLAPPLVITKEEITQGMDIMLEIFNDHN